MNMSDLTNKYHISVMPEPDEMPMGLQSGSGSAASSSGSIESSSGSSGCDGMGVEQDCTITLSASGGNADPDTGSIEIPISAAGSAPTAGDCCDLNEPDYSFWVIEVLSSISAEGPWESADSSLSILPDAASPQQALLQGTLNKGGRFYQIRLSASATWSAEESDNDCENCSGCDSCTAETETTLIAYRPCPSGCDKTVTVTPKLNPIYRWVIDDNACAVTLKVRVILIFFNPTREIPEPDWTSTKIENYKSMFASTVEDAFANNYAIIADDIICCPCTSYQPMLKIELTNDEDAIQIGIMSGVSNYVIEINGVNESKRDWTRGSIFNIETIGIGPNNDRSDISMGLKESSLEKTIKSTPPSTSPCHNIEQIIAAHEFGHLIGLEHPGQDLTPVAEPGSLADYEADADGLMSCGMSLRKKYFEK